MAQCVALDGYDGGFIISERSLSAELLTTRLLIASADSTWGNAVPKVLNGPKPRSKVTFMPNEKSTKYRNP